jgi:hypothetical protein
LNFAAELLLESDHKLNGVEAVGTKIIDEARVLRHLVRVDPETFHDDLLNSFHNVSHFSIQSLIQESPSAVRRWRGIYRWGLSWHPDLHPYLASVLQEGPKSANIHASSGAIRGVPDWYELLGWFS